MQFASILHQLVPFIGNPAKSRYPEETTGQPPHPFEWHETKPTQYEQIINEEPKTNNIMPSSVARGSEVPSLPLPAKSVAIYDVFLQQECYNASGGAEEALQVEEKSKEEELIPLQDLKQRLRDHLDKITKPRIYLAFMRSSKILRI